MTRDRIDYLFNRGLMTYDERDAALQELEIRRVQAAVHALDMIPVEAGLLAHDYKLI